MFERLQSFFQGLTENRQTSAIAPDDPRITVAALCFQVMEADGLVHEDERRKLREILEENYEVEGDKLDALMLAAQTAESEAVDYYRFTVDLKRQLDDEQRQNLVGILWDIVYADGARSEMEDHAIWRISDLLAVSPRDRILQRQDAERRAGLGVTDDVG
ncbi:TerB family tellurite resistance protein [Rhizobium sp. G187]|uniref:tellurite resistance TerB family protein n=1 Tax=unclassified Rhizobium TaxID=2613769 RepID=UPI0006B9B377|nr:TerB family tellurite resistance protein [Rhizobium sp. AAP43]KPF45016.1 hypothetical protein IP76_09180 [Rhizobium sp. AAP43]